MSRPLLSIVRTPDKPGPGPGWTTHPSFYFRRVEQLRQVMVENGDAQKQIWLTEFGWASATKAAPGFEYAEQVTEQEQADYIGAAMRMSRDQYPWMGPMLVFGLNFSLPNVSTDPGDERIAWSLLRRDGSKREALEQRTGTLRPLRPRETDGRLRSADEHPWPGHRRHRHPACCGHPGASR